MVNYFVKIGKPGQNRWEISKKAKQKLADWVSQLKTIPILGKYQSIEGEDVDRISGKYEMKRCS